MKAILRIALVFCLVSSVLAEEPYFPVRTSSDGQSLSDSEAEWYGKVLERMKEPRLPSSAKDSNAVIYRLMILPTWGSPVVVRVQKTNNLYTLFARRFDGQGGYDPGKLAEQKEVHLTQNDSAALDQLIANVNFFHMRTDDHELGKDGDEWILEGVSSGAYHVVERWCPSSEQTNERGLTPFIGLARFLIDHSTLSQRPSNKGYKLL